jgi:hypothetical protein
MDLDNFIYFIIEVQTGARMSREPALSKKRPSEIIAASRQKRKNIEIGRADFLGASEKRKKEISDFHDDYTKKSPRAARFLKKPEMKTRASKIYPYGG